MFRETNGAAMTFTFDEKWHNITWKYENIQSSICYREPSQATQIDFPETRHKFIINKKNTHQNAHL